MKFPRLREKRKSQGLTRRYFESHNISERTIATLETNDCNPKIETIEAVAKALNSTIGELRGDKPEDLSKLELLEKENQNLKEKLQEKDQELIIYLKELNELRKQS